MKFLLVLGATTLLVACGAEQAAAPPASPKPTFGSFGIDLTAMDTSVKPGDDFYRYVNGRWVSSFTMPADKARYGVFDALRDKSENDVRTLLEELEANPPASGSVQKKVADLYSSWMDEAAIEARTPSSLMLLGGEPVGERYLEWNFVSSSRERLEQAKADWRAGRFKLPDFDDREYIPLPD